MLSALIYAGEVLNNSTYTQAAESLLFFFEENMISQNGVLHYYDPNENQAYLDGQLLDTSFMARALLESYQYTNDHQYLLSAENLLDYMLASLYDVQGGGFNERNSTSVNLYRNDELVRTTKSEEENGIAAYAMALAFNLTGNGRYSEAALTTLGRFMYEQVRLKNMVYYSGAISKLTGQNNPPVLIDLSTTHDGKKVNFNVRFYDIEGDTPSYMNVVIDGETYNLTPNYQSAYWLRYTASISLSPGDHVYYFEGNTYKRELTDSLGRELRFHLNIKSDEDVPLVSVEVIIGAIVLGSILILLWAVLKERQKGLRFKGPKDDSERLKKQVLSIKKKHPKWSPKRIADEVNKNLPIGKRMKTIDVKNILRK
jgi:hypothetical protein